MATLIENEGLVSLYKGENDSILVEINGKELILDPFYSFNHNEIWNPVAVDLFSDPRSDNDNNILLLWNNVDHFVQQEELYGIRESNLRSIFYKAYQALSFSSENGKLLGVYDIYGNFVAYAEADKVPIENFFYTEGLYDRLGEYYGDIYNSHKNSGDSSNLTDFQAYNYIASNSDLISSIGIDIEAAKSHYTNTGKSEGRSFDSFSATNYLAKYGDLSEAFGDDQTAALKHYIQYGFSEGRTDTLTESGSGSGSGSSSTLTNLEAYNYIASHSDLITAFGIDIEAAKSHYENYGKAEGRSLDNFDEWGYLASNNDLIISLGGDTTEAVKHYISFGYSQGKITSSFDAQSYLSNYADLRNIYGDNKELATKHYVEYGFNEGRFF